VLVSKKSFLARGMVGRKDERSVGVDLLGGFPDAILGINAIKVREQVEEDLEVEVMTLRDQGRMENESVRRVAHGFEVTESYVRSS
jgi:dihydroxyacetone kinase DhaKLM complex PTS-EIIA-like component DhaM